MNNKSPGLEQHLENIDVPEVKPLHHQQQLKLTILNAKKSATISLWLLVVPFIVLFGGLMQSAFHVMLPPWSWLVKYSPLMPLWLRLAIFVSVVIVLPLIAVFINVLGILWFKYDKAEHVLQIAVRMHRTNIIIITIAGILALLFIGHTITEWITNG